MFQRAFVFSRVVKRKHSARNWEGTATEARWQKFMMGACVLSRINYSIDIWEDGIDKFIGSDRFDCLMSVTWLVY
jgi:hypothetical protein